MSEEEMALAKTLLAMGSDATLRTLYRTMALRYMDRFVQRGASGASPGP
jgi:hypothetical protein